MTMAYIIAMRSSDKSTKVGAVVVDPNNVVVSMGYNGWCRGVEPWEDDDPRHQRPMKYLHTEHAERNAIYNAARQGKQLDGCKIYVSLLPCMDCARAIVQTGIQTVVMHTEGQEAFWNAFETKEEARWSVDHQECQKLFQEAGVELRWWSGKIISPFAFYNGKKFNM